MTGERLAAAATVTAGLRAAGAGEHAVLAFARDVRTLRPLHAASRPAVVDRVLALRGHGVTAARRRAAGRLGPARRRPRRAAGGGAALGLPAHRRGGPGPGRPGAGRAVILAPRDDADEARRLAGESGARMAEVTGVDKVPDLLEKLLSTH